jgi:prepilin-type N-terminal cleavage/methylation domain-containing protein
MKRRATTAFTLIEMLTVIAIIGVILAVGIPAFTNMMKSGGLSAASRQIASTLTLARQYAITKRTNVRVVFPYSGTTGGGINLAPPYQSYTAIAINGTTTNYISKWEHLPLGTVFMDINAGVGSPPCLNDLGTANLPFPTNTNAALGPGNSAILAFIEFRPTGAASNPGTFTITEGFVSGTTVTPTSRNGITLANVVTVSVDNVVGRIQVRRP